MVGNLRAVNMTVASLVSRWLYELEWQDLNSARLYLGGTGLVAATGWVPKERAATMTRERDYNKGSAVILSRISACAPNRINKFMNENISAAGACMRMPHSTHECCA